MGIFGPPNIEKLKAAKNFNGLIGALKDKDYHIQDKAITALADIGNPAIEPLIGASKHKDWKIRSGAAKALGKIGGDKAIENLIEALNSKEYFGLRTTVINALGSIKDARVVEPLINSLKYTLFSYDRRAAAEALGKIGDERAVEPLNEALKDREFGVRSAAAKALTSLNKTLKDKDSDVQREVHEIKKGEVRCSKCGKIIGQLSTTIGEDIRRGGGVVIGGGSLDIPMYQCTICESCGSAFCDICQRPNPDPCPKCGKSNLRPGFADLVQKYYKF